MLFSITALSMAVLALVIQIQMLIRLMKLKYRILDEVVGRVDRLERLARMTGGGQRPFVAWRATEAISGGRWRRWISGRRRGDETGETYDSGQRP